MKTVKEWLETLDEPYRSQALENLFAPFASILEANILEALSGGFDWGESNQGFAYWEELYMQIHDKHFI
jgi:hypothetical protein